MRHLSTSFRRLGPRQSRWAEALASGKYIQILGPYGICDAPSTLAIKGSLPEDDEQRSEVRRIEGCTAFGLCMNLFHKECGMAKLIMAEWHADEWWKPPIGGIKRGYGCRAVRVFVPPPNPYAPQAWHSGPPHMMVRDLLAFRTPNAGNETHESIFGRENDPGTTFARMAEAMRRFPSWFFTEER